MFLDRRVYQGSSGKVYPLPFTDRIAEQKINRPWRAVWLENRYLRLMLLPELGGRIHIAQDKTNGYDFIYNQKVIKPALVGLAGPWISGGIEFNWPQHHRPATFLPTDVEIEEHDDGAKTVWLGDHDPMRRMKGMHGVCLHPDKAYVEIKVRAYNRTDFSQPFLWWANIGVAVDETYQSFFPPDARHVADHAKRAMSDYPLCRGMYYGIDYGRRRRVRRSAKRAGRDFSCRHIAAARRWSIMRQTTSPGLPTFPRHALTCAWAPAGISSVVMTMPGTRASFILPTIISHPAKNNGPGAIMSSVTRGTGISRTTNGRTLN